MRPLFLLFSLYVRTYQPTDYMNQIKIARPVFQSPFDKARSAQVEPMAGHDGLLLARLCILAEEIQNKTLANHSSLRSSMFVIASIFWHRSGAIKTIWNPVLRDDAPIKMGEEKS